MRLCTHLQGQFLFKHLCSLFYYVFAVVFLFNALCHTNSLPYELGPFSLMAVKKILNKPIASTSFFVFMLTTGDFGIKNNEESTITKLMTSMNNTMLFVLIRPSSQTFHIKYHLI